MKQALFIRSIGVFLAVSAVLFSMPGCQKSEGPMEKAGKDIDQTVENLGQPKAGPAEQAGQSVDNATANVGEKIEQAGAHIQDAARDKP